MSTRDMYVRTSASQFSTNEERCWHRRDPSSDMTFRKTFCGRMVSSFIHRTFDVQDVRDQDPHCETCFACFPEDWNPQGLTSPDAMPSRPEEAYVPSAPEIIAGQLLNLSREQLRRLAWDALMASDGPYCTFADPASDYYQDAKDSMFNVIMRRPPFEGSPAVFLISSLGGWQDGTT